MSPHASGMECDGVRTVVEVRDRLQDMTIGIQRFRPTDLTRWVPVRVKDDLGVDKVA